MPQYHVRVCTTYLHRGIYYHVHKNYSENNATIIYLQIVYFYMREVCMCKTSLYVNFLYVQKPLYVLKKFV